MKTSSAKGKGRALQQNVKKKLDEAFNFQEGDVESRPMGSGGVDLMMSPHARLLFPFSLECKNTKKFPSLSALRQSKANAYKDTTAAAVWKPPGKGMDESIIYFNLKEFIEWVRNQK